MSLTYIINKFIYLSESTGLPPLVLICIGVLLVFLTFLGLMILSKLRSIRIALFEVNRGLIALNNKIIQHKNADHENLKLVFQKKTLNKNVKESSDKTLQSPKMKSNTGNPANNGSDFPEKNLMANRKEKLNLQTRIINLLKMSSRPMSYNEIAKSLSNDSADYDFEYILSELEQLKSEGKIVDRVSGGKLFFRINT